MLLKFLSRLIGVCFVHQWGPSVTQQVYAEGLTPEGREKALPIASYAIDECVYCGKIRRQKT